MSTSVSSAQQKAIDQTARQAEQSVIKKHDEMAEIGQVVPDGFTSLGVPYELDDTLYRTRNWMVSPAVFKGKKFPRFGLMSLTLAGTPCHLYDNEVMNGITTTAFTDGISVYIHAGFWEMLLKEQEESNGQRKGPVQIIMHELMHKILRHVDRHMKYERGLANRAQDKIINTRIQRGFPELDPWADTLRETGLGFGQGDKEKYPLMTEEAAMLEIMAARKKAIKAPKKSKDEGESGKSGGNPGAGGGSGAGSGSGDDDMDEPRQPGDSSPSDEEDWDDNDPSDGSERDGRFGAEDDEHTITPEELSRRMKAGGMDESMRRLKIPDPSDQAAHDRLKKNADMQRVDAISRAMQDMERNGGEYPGADIVTYCSDMLRAETRGKLRWRLEFRAAVMNAKRESKYVEDDEPNEIYHVDEISEILGQPLYTGVYVQHSKASVVLFMIDVSGSMGNPDVRAALTEAFALKRAANSFTDTASEVLILQCDTHIKDNHLIELNESNQERLFKEGIQRQAMGGTNLEQCLIEAMNLKKVKGKDVRAVVFVTDSYDVAPKRANLPAQVKNSAIIYAIVPSAGMERAEAFAKELDHGRVAYIDDGVEVDLTEGYLKKMDASPRNQKNRRRMS